MAKFKLPPLAFDPKSEFVLRGEPHKEAVELVEGCVVSEITPQKGEYIVYTPRGWVRVRGTTFTTGVEYSNAPKTGEAGRRSKESATVSVSVTSGMVEYELSGQTGTLRAGETRLFAQAKPLEPTTDATKKASAPAPPEDAGAARLYGQAAQLRHNGNDERAMPILREVVAKYPKSNWAGCALFSIGDIFRRRQKYNEAIETYRSVARDYPDSKFGNGKPVAPFCACYAAVCLYLTGDQAAGRAAFDEAVKKYPDATNENGGPMSDLLIDIIQGKGAPPGAARQAPPAKPKAP